MCCMRCKLCLRCNRSTCQYLHTKRGSMCGFKQTGCPLKIFVPSLTPVITGLLVLSCDQQYKQPSDKQTSSCEFSGDDLQRRGLKLFALVLDEVGTGWAVFQLGVCLLVVFDCLLWWSQTVCLKPAWHVERDRTSCSSALIPSKFYQTQYNIVLCCYTASLKLQMNNGGCFNTTTLWNCPKVNFSSDKKSNIWVEKLAKKGKYHNNIFNMDTLQSRSSSVHHLYANRVGLFFTFNILAKAPFGIVCMGFYWGTKMSPSWAFDEWIENTDRAHLAPGIWH